MKKLLMMRRLGFGKTVFIALLCSLPIQVNAGIIPLNISFTDPVWSAAVSYDDTTAQPFAGNNLITVFSITSFLATDGVATWDTTELQPESTPNSRGVLLGTNGVLVVFVGATDIVTGNFLSGGFGGNSTTGAISSGSFSNLGSTGSRSAYSVTVPEPGTLGLLALGLLGLAFARRKE